jgi:preprotein translocase subunit SecE
MNTDKEELKRISGNVIVFILLAIIVTAFMYMFIAGLDSLFN